MPVAECILGRRLGEQILVDSKKSTQPQAAKTEAQTESEKKIKQIGVIAAVTLALLIATCVCGNPDTARLLTAGTVVAGCMIPMPWLLPKMNQMLDDNLRNNNDNPLNAGNRI